MARPETLRHAIPGLRRFIARVWPAVREERTLISLSALALVGQVAFRLLEPWPLKFVFDRVAVLGPHGGSSGVAFVDALDPPTLLALCALAVVGVAGLQAVTQYASTVGFALAGNRVMLRIRTQLYRHLQGLSPSFHSKARSGDLLTRVIGDVGILKEVLVTAFLPLVVNLLILLGMVAVMLALHPGLALAALIPLPLLWVLTLRKSRQIARVGRKQRQRESHMATTAAESIGAIEVVQTLSLQERFAGHFGGAARRDLKEGVQGKRLAASLERSVDVLIAASSAIVLWLGARGVLGGSLTPGDLLVFLTYLRRAMRPLRDFAKYSARLAKASSAGERVLELLEEEPAVRDLPGAVPAPTLRGELRFEDVCFGYEGEEPVLRHIDFAVAAGERVALVGPSGAGKSTLLGLVLRLFDPTTGRVRIDGHDLRALTLDSLRSQVSVVLQDGVLFAASVRENVACGTAEAAPEEIVSACRLANADEFIARLPEGYDTTIGERGATLSRGQQQRLAVARAAVRKAPIQLLDEPTSGLDERNARAVSQALERLAAQRTTLLVTHDLDAAARCDRVLYLEQGRLLECGTHEELLRAGGHYARLWRVQRPEDVPGALQEAASAVAG